MPHHHTTPCNTRYVGRWFDQFDGFTDIDISVCSLHITFWIAGDVFVMVMVFACWLPVAYCGFGYGFGFGCWQGKYNTLRYLSKSTLSVGIMMKYFLHRTLTHGNFEKEHHAHPLAHRLNDNVNTYTNGCFLENWYSLDLFYHKHKRCQK